MCWGGGGGGGACKGCHLILHRKVENLTYVFLFCTGLLGGRKHINNESGKA